MINKLKHLAWKLKVNLKEINYIIDNIDKFYGEKINPKTDKFNNPRFDINGKPKVRILNPSRNRLKVIQKRIHRNILAEIKMPEYAFGSVKKKDNILNAKKHQGKKYKLTTDIRNFFPSISHSQVFAMFRKNGFSPTVSKILTQLTTYKGKIPQGAPTSSTIANLVMIKTGNKLNRFAKENNMTFTSYVDDLTFSSPVDFKDKVDDILEILTIDGFKISMNKTFYSRNPVVTGVIPMNNHLKLPNLFIQKIENTEGKSGEQIKGLKRYKDRVVTSNYNKKIK